MKKPEDTEEDHDDPDSADEGDTPLISCSAQVWE
jgi:hypothetical protein